MGGINMNLKKLAVGITTFTAAALMLTGCGNSSSNKKSDSSNTISFWYGGDGDSAIKPIIKDFTKETGIKVKVQSIPWTQYNDKLLTAAASKSGPDLIDMGTTSVPNFVSSNSLMDITDTVKKDSSLAPDKYFPGSVETTKVDGKYYGVPWYTETRVLYYRKDLLKKVGYNEAPKTWDEMYDAAIKLSKRGKGMYGMNIDANEQTFGFMFARQNGAQLLTKNNKTDFNKKPTVDAVKYLQKFVKNGATPKNDLKLSIGESFGGKGVLPMMITGPWEIKAIREDSGLKDDQWGVAELPKGKVSNTSATGGGDLAVFKYTKHKKESIKLLKYLSKRENQLKYYKNSDSLPARKDAWNAKELQTPKIQTIRDQLNHSKPMPLIKQWDQIGQDYNKAWEKVSVENADVQKTMDDLNKQANDSIKK